MEIAMRVLVWLFILVPVGIGIQLVLVHTRHMRRMRELETAHELRPGETQEDALRRVLEMRP